MKRTSSYFRSWITQSCDILNRTTKVGAFKPKPVTVSMVPPLKEPLNVDGDLLLGLTDVTVCWRIIDASDGLSIRRKASPFPATLTFTRSQLLIVGSAAVSRLTVRLVAEALVTDARKPPKLTSLSDEVVLKPVPLMVIGSLIKR